MAVKLFDERELKLPLNYGMMATEPCSGLSRDFGR